MGRVAAKPVFDGPRAHLALSLPGEELLTWLAVEKGRSPNTLVAYRRDIAAYEAWLRARGDGADGSALAMVTEPTVAEYVAHLGQAGLAPSSVARALVAVRSLHRFMVQEGNTSSDPSADLSPPPVP
jgi:integrase/recombinase XerD